MLSLAPLTPDLPTLAVVKWCGRARPTVQIAWMKEFARINIGRVLATIARARAFNQHASPRKRHGVTILVELAGTLYLHSCVVYRMPPGKDHSAHAQE